MSLVQCPECGANISDQALQCVQCGLPRKRPRGIDKGFCLNYYKLSYRRKLIRTLWLSPVVLMVLAVSKAFFWICLLLLAAQAVYNFAMWQKYEA